MRRTLQISRCSILALAALTSTRAAAYATSVVVYDGWGTPTSFTVGRRVLEDQGEVAPKKSASRAESLLQNLKALESDEVRFSTVSVSVAGQTFTATTDDDGNFTVRVKNLPAAQALPLGPVPVDVKLLKVPGRADASLKGGVGAGTIFIYDERAELTAIISDFDDTIVKTHVLDKPRMAEAVLFKNAAQLEPVGGAASSYRAAQAAGVGAFFYLSGSPQNFHARIQSFLAAQRFPRGPILLKNFGDDSPLQQEGYKLGRLEALLKEVPHMKVILIGDTGERDPEIYAALARRHPSRVAGIVIRETPGSNVDAARLEGMVTFDDAYETDGLIAGLLASSAPLEVASPPSAQTAITHGAAP